MLIYFRAVVFAIIAVLVLVTTCVVDSRAIRSIPQGIFQFM